MKTGEFVLVLVLTLLSAAGLVYAFSMREPAPGTTEASKSAPAAAPATGDKKDAMNTTAIKAKISGSGYDVTPLGKERVDELAKKLSADDARIILNKGTEPAFCGNLLDNKEQGTYVCKLCALPLFSSKAKFNSGTGWPSFFQPFDTMHVAVKEDRSHGMVREEILCARCGGHLGHVFDDGPKPTGLRFCLNGASLTFHKEGELPAESKPLETKTAYFAGGCFWGVEDRFEQLPGVLTAISGYMGGKTQNPTYKQVCYTDTGHAETVKIVFDPKKITYRQLLEKFFKFHDPTTMNRQGPDVGPQYRSAIFAADEEQVKEAKAVIEELSKKPKYQSRKIVTQVVEAKEAGQFWEAEGYHQDYHAKNGGHCTIPPDDE